MTKLQRLEKTLFFLILLFLPTQLGKHFWPNFSYIYSLKIDYLSPAIYSWDILVIGLLIVWILQKPKINKQALNLLLFFLLTQVLSLVKAVNTGAGLVRIEQYLLAGLFGVYLASSNLEALLKKMPLPLGLAIIVESILAVLQFIKGSTLGFWILGERSFSITTPGIAKFDFYGTQVLRPYATFPHPNVLAGFILVGLSILYQVLKVKSRLVFLPLLLGGIIVFLTVSRVAILTGITTLSLTVKRKWFLWIIIILVISSPILFTRFSSLLNFDNLAVIRREELSEKAWQIFLKQPLLGVGLNNFIPQIAGNLVAGPSRFLQPVHNIILLSLAETGLVGLLGWIALMGYPFRKILNIVPWLIILTIGMFDHYFLTLPQGYRLLFLVWGLSFLHVRIA
ncbi:O-antigen ligase family protein [Candidatus Daviesbacteria bacterium]|nr:O-antigen ligase family protein [Candidatus Daviesbacteria bacterium]